MKKTHLIWTAFPNYDDWKKDLEYEYPDMDDDERWERMMEINSYYLDDERINLSMNLGKPILVIANLGLWNGRHVGYKEIKSGKVEDCLWSDYDPVWYVDELGDLRCDDHHHDGCNHYLYRVWKDVSEQQRENFLEKLLYGEVTRRDITRYTASVGKEVCKVYGW